jgi:hypothetical protein
MNCRRLLLHEKRPLGFEPWTFLEFGAWDLDLSPAVHGGSFVCRRISPKTPNPPPRHLGGYEFLKKTSKQSRQAALRNPQSL